MTKRVVDSCARLIAAGLLALATAAHAAEAASRSRVGLVPDRPARRHPARPGTGGRLPERGVHGNEAHRGAAFDHAVRGGETPIWPLYLGYAYSTSGTWNAYFFLGTP